MMVQVCNALRRGCESRDISGCANSKPVSFRVSSILPLTYRVRRW